MTSKDTRLTISKIQFNLEELGNLLEERNNIYELDLIPSKNDNFELISLILKAIQYFRFVNKDITDEVNSEEKEHIGSELEELVKEYNDIYNQLSEDSNLDISEYKYSFTPRRQIAKFHLITFINQYCLKIHLMIMMRVS